MSYQSGFFSSTPVNFNRFLAMTRSSSRSLSPERELQQMMSHVHRPQSLSAQKASGTKRACNTRAVPETAASVAATSFTRATPTLRGASPSRSTSSDAAALASSSLSTSRAHHAEAGVSTTHMDTEAEPSNPTATESCAALNWQYGSPVYYPVTDAFYCWEGHALRPKRRGEYGDLEGVSCDFCGFTHWLSHEADKKQELKPSKTTARSRSKREPAVKEEVKEIDSSHATTSAELETTFYHCDSCDVDLCMQCLEEICADERYHVPCMKCLKCLCYVSLQNATAHRCLPASSATTFSAALPALVVDSLKPEERASRLGLAPTATPIKAEEEMDLLGPVPVMSQPAPLAAQSEPSSPPPRRSRKGRAAKPEPPSGASPATDSSAKGQTSPRRKAAKHESDAGPSPGTDAEAVVMPPQVKGLWTVQVVTRTAEDRAEAIRLATVQGLPDAEEAPRKRALLFHLPTRLAAEKCASRARDSGLEAVVQKNA